MKFICNITDCSNTLTDVHYQIQKNNTRHILGNCSEHGRRYLKYVKDLSLPVRLSKATVKRYRREATYNQPLENKGQVKGQIALFKLKSY